MTKCSLCMQSFKSIDNSLAKLRRGVDTIPPPPEREGVEKYHLREMVKGKMNCLFGSHVSSRACIISWDAPLRLTDLDTILFPPPARDLQNPIPEVLHEHAVTEGVCSWVEKDQKHRDIVPYWTVSRRCFGGHVHQQVRRKVGRPADQVQTGDKN